MAQSSDNWQDISGFYQAASNNEQANPYRHDEFAHSNYGWGVQSQAQVQHHQPYPEQPNPYGYRPEAHSYVDQQMQRGHVLGSHAFQGQHAHSPFPVSLEPYSQSSQMPVYSNGQATPSHGQGVQFFPDHGHQSTTIASMPTLSAHSSYPYPAISAASIGPGGLNSQPNPQPQYEMPHRQPQFQTVAFQVQTPGHVQHQYQQPREQVPARQLTSEQMQEAALATGEPAQKTPTAHQLIASAASPKETIDAAPPSQSWVRPAGCLFLEVFNPPPTKAGKFSDIGPSSYSIQRDTPLLPERSTRLPCEIQGDLDKLNEELKKTTTKSSRDKISRRIKDLYNEPVILADIPESKPKDTKVKITRKKTSNMDSGKKASTASDATRDDNPTNILAREILEENQGKKDPSIEYKIIKILWRGSKGPNPQVLESVTDFGNYVTDLWSKSKELKIDMDKASSSGDHDKADALRVEMESVYGDIRAAIEAALKFGEQFTLSQLGHHTKLLGGLFILLRNLFKSGDYSGALPKAIMRLTAKLITVNTAFLKKIKFDSVYLKYKNELDTEAREYLDKVFDNAKKRSIQEAKNEEAKIEEAKKEEASKSQLPTAKKQSTMSPRDSPTASKMQPAKKETLIKKPTAEIKKMQPTDYSGLGSARKVTKRPGDEDVDLRAPKKTALETSASVSSQAPKTTLQARARPSGSMLPGRSRVPAKAPPKKVVQAPTSSTIGSLLDQISKPKEMPKRKVEPERAPETPEETARRLRKESRRHLRVAWKPDHLLTEVKVFEHDTAEDKGRDHNMLRDARDNRSEGQMLKQRVRDDVDDDDDGTPEEVNLRALEWHVTATGPPDIDDKKRSKYYITANGFKPVESEQRQVMEEHENRELMAIYTSLSEIPESPRSPPHRSGIYPNRIHVVPSTPSMWQTSLEPDNPIRIELHRRWAERAQFGRTTSMHFALQRYHQRLAKEAEEKHSKDNAHGSHSQQQQANHEATTRQPNLQESHPQPNDEDLTRGRDLPEIARQSLEMMELLFSDKVKNYTDPDPYDPEHPKTQRRHDYADPKVQRDIDGIEDVFAEYAGAPYPPTEPPAHIRSNPERVAEWHAGRNQDSVAQAIQSQLQSQPQPQLQFQQQPQPQLQSQTPYILPQAQAFAQPFAAPAPPPAPAAPAPTEQLQAILATLSVTQPNPAPPVQQKDLPAWLLANQLAGQSLGQPESTQPYGVQPQAPAYNAQLPSGYGAQSQVPQSYGAQSQTTQSYGAQTPQVYGAQSQAAQSAPAYGDYSQYAQSQDGQNQRDYNDRNSRKNFHRGEPNKDHGNKGINRSLIGTKACSFWAKGQCAKGDKCTFRHDPNDLK